jgi:mitogen-activated protein kinase 15
MILEQLSGQNSIIRMKKVLKSQNDKDLYITFDFLDADIHRVFDYYFCYNKF